MTVRERVDVDGTNLSAIGKGVVGLEGDVVHSDEGLVAEDASSKSSQPSGSFRMTIPGLSRNGELMIRHEIAVGDHVCVRHNSCTTSRQLSTHFVVCFAG